VRKGDFKESMTNSEEKGYGIILSKRWKKGDLEKQRDEEIEGL
jgi:hypothetical protein